MQWRRDRVVLPLQTSLLQSQENEQIVHRKRDKNWFNMREAVIVEDACVDTSEESLPLFSALSEHPNINRSVEQCEHRTPKKSKPAENTITNYKSNWKLEQALISAREEIINLLAMNLRSTYDTGIVRDGFIVQFDEDVGGLGCHVGNSYATTSHLFLEDTQICLKSGTLHYDKTSCADEQQNNSDVSENITNCIYNSEEQEEEEYYNYECVQQKEKALHVRHLQKLPIYTTKWERSSSYSLQRSVINNDEISSDAEDVDLCSLHRLHQHNNYCGSNNYDMSEFIGLSRSGVHKFVIANGGSKLAWLSYCHCTDEINVDVTCTDDWGLHCSVVGLSSGELVVVDWRCSQNSNNMNRSVLVSSVPRPPWEYTSRSRAMASNSKEVNTAAITSCAAFESNYRVLAGLKDHHGSLVITDLRRPSKDYFGKEGKTTYSNKTPRKPLANCHHSRGKWEKMIIGQFVNGAGCLPTGHPISEIVHCPGNTDRVGLVDIHGQAMCLSMNALEHGECSLYEHNYKEPSYKQQEELLQTNKWDKSNKFAESVIGKYKENKKTIELYNTRLKRRREAENTYTQINNDTSGNNEENNSNVDMIDVDAFVDSDNYDNNDSECSDDNDDRSKGQETNNVNRTFCSGNVVSTEISPSSTSSSSTCLLPQRENMLCKRVHSHEYIQNAYSHSIYEMALRSLSPLLSADEQTILRLQNVQMQLENKRNKITRRCVFLSDGKLLVHSTHSLLGISIMPASGRILHHQSSLLSSCESNSVTAASTAKELYSMETFRVHHKACCNRKGDAVVGVSVAGHNVLSVTTMLGQTWNILLEEDRSAP